MSLIIKRSVLFGLRAPHHSQVRFGTNIPVLLLEDVEKKGKAGEVIVVSRGFARNYLVPQKIAAYATKENKARHVAPGTKTILPTVSNNIADYLKSKGVEKLVLTLSVNWNRNVPVTPTDIRQLLAANGANLERKAIIELNEQIKTAGAYTVKVNGEQLQIDVVEKSDL